MIWSLITMANWEPNRLDIFGLGSDNEVYHKAWDGSRWLPSPTAWEVRDGARKNQPGMAAWVQDRPEISGWMF